jgi:uncharacterized protein YndB with AHSA1/START domain
VGDRAFAAYTAAAVEKMEIEPSTLTFTRHIEAIPDLGEVEVLIQDLQAAWELENERSRVFVTKDEAKMIETFEFPLPPAVVWDLLTNPAKRIRWQSSLTSLDMVTDGRLGQGSINHCVHGPNRIVEHVVDWRPFSYFTVAYELEDDELWPWTFELEPTEGGTRVSWRLSNLGEGRMDFFDDWLARWQEDAKGDVPLLNELVAEEVGRLGPWD